MRRGTTTTVILIALSSLFSTVGSAEEVKLDARVDTRVELMSLIFRLAGAGEYNHALSASPYSREIAARFGKFVDHPVVDAARELRRKHGIGYDAVMSMALHIEDTVTLAEKIPFHEKPACFDRRWPLGEARAFLVKARDFVKVSDFNAFMGEQEKFFRATSKRMEKKLRDRAYIKWFDRFFGTRPKARFFVIVGMLNGPGNYGVGIRRADGSEEISPILGASEFDGEGLPVFGDFIVSTVVHEFCHSYTNALVDKHADELRRAGKRLFGHCRDVMARQAYGSWKTMMYESFVRSCVVRYLEAADGPAVAAEEIKNQHRRGFEWVGDFSALLRLYEKKRTDYPDLDAFVPEIVTFFDLYAEKFEKLIALAPKIVSIDPPNGAENVDPDLAAITVTFDRPMRDKSWSVVGGGPHHPEGRGGDRYDEKCLVFTWPVRLKPEWSYNFWLNYGEYDNFKSSDGRPLRPVTVRFRTGK